MASDTAWAAEATRARRPLGRQQGIEWARDRRRPAGFQCIPCAQYLLRQEREDYSLQRSCHQRVTDRL